MTDWQSQRWPSVEADGRPNTTALPTNARSAPQRGPTKGHVAVVLAGGVGDVAKRAVGRGRRQDYGCRTNVPAIRDAIVLMLPTNPLCR
ncbi:hypothetical protein, partial [Actinoplanes philippinensis]|uniref:hypothetical protein n=1 Tax=Actinoplanes philippinensis TaxID=35752 RepID=UPI0033FF86B2